MRGGSVVFSLTVQRQAGWNAGGTARGQPCCNDGDRREQSRRQNGQRGVHAPASGHGRHERPRTDGEEHPHTETGTQQPSSLTENQPQHVSLGGADRHAQSNFLATLAHAVRHQRVDTRDREEQSREREDSEEREIETPRPEPCLDQRAKGAGAGAGGITINGAELGRKRSAERGGISRSSDDPELVLPEECHAVWMDLAQGNVDVECRWRVERRLPHVLEDADDLYWSGATRVVVDQEVLADGLGERTLVASAELTSATGSESDRSVSDSGRPSSCRVPTADG